MFVKLPFKNGEQIPKDYTFDGKNVSPEILIEKIPKEAKSLVIIVDDPDAKRVCGFTWIHWVVFDIPIKSSSLTIKENSCPGIPGKNHYNVKDYKGPSPPKGSGIHHYYFKFYLLKDFLRLPEMSSLEEIEEKMRDLIIEKEEIFGLYERK